MRIATWRLSAGNKKDQETTEQKRQKGLEYIEKLRQEDEVLEVIEEPNKFIIKLKD